MQSILMNLKARKYISIMVKYIWTDGKEAFDAAHQDSKLPRHLVYLNAVIPYGFPGNPLKHLQMHKLACQIASKDLMVVTSFSKSRKTFHSYKTLEEHENEKLEEWRAALDEYENEISSQQTLEEIHNHFNDVLLKAPTDFSNLFQTNL